VVYCANRSGLSRKKSRETEIHLERRATRKQAEKEKEGGPSCTKERPRVRSRDILRDAERSILCEKRGLDGGEPRRGRRTNSPVLLMSRLGVDTAEIWGNIQGRKRLDNSDEKKKKKRSSIDPPNEERGKKTLSGKKKTRLRGWKKTGIKKRTEGTRGGR